MDSNDSEDHSDVVISDEPQVVVVNNDKWRSNLPRDIYASPKLWESHTEFLSFMEQFDILDENENENENNNKHDEEQDHLWEQVKLEALSSLSTEPEAGPQLYQSILSQGSLVEAIVSTIARTL
jgi:riboflavin biosynthesis pyrimidine reductase